MSTVSNLHIAIIPHLQFRWHMPQLFSSYTGFTDCARNSATVNSITTSQLLIAMLTLSLLITEKKKKKPKKA